MTLLHILSPLALFSAVWLPSVSGSLFVIEPSSTRICHGGQTCTFEWLDNGKAPLLTDIGPCHVALYNGEQRLVQQIEPVNVATVHSLQFTPNPIAGPDSSQYYINFTSANPVNGATYEEYTSFFRLDQMSGSFQSPIPSLTSTIPVPSSILAPSSSPPASLPASDLSASSNGMSILRTSSSNTLTPTATGSPGITQSNSSYRYRYLHPVCIFSYFIALFFGHLAW